MQKMRFILILFFFLTSLNNLKSQIITVSKDASGDYATIQEAINGAESGTLIRVESGLYKGPVVMKEGVSLEGIDFPIIDGANTGAVVTMASNTYITGFKIVHSGAGTDMNDCGVLVQNVVNATILENDISSNGHYGIILDKAKCQIHYNQISKNDFLGIYISDSCYFDIGFNTLQFHEHSGINITGEHVSGNIYNNLITNNHKGIDIHDSQSELPAIHIYNNIIYLNDIGINALQNYYHNVSYNSFYMNYFNLLDWNSRKQVKLSKTNIFKDPRLNIADAKYLFLTEKSPCINGGTQGNDMGVYKFDNGKERNYANRSWEINKSAYFAELEGIALNVTADSTKSDFSGVLYSEDGVHFKFKGSYDNINLFGYVEMNGLLESQDSDSYLLIQFNEGTVYLGNDNSGYPKDFSISHTGSLSISNVNVRGTYKCGTHLPYLPNDQYGYYDLTIKNISKEMKKFIQMHVN